MPLSRTVGDFITGTIIGAGNALEHTVSAARGVTVGTLSGSREALNEVQELVTDVMKGTIQATGGVGAELGSTSKGGVIGGVSVVLGAPLRGEEKKDAQ